MVIRGGQQVTNLVLSALDADAGGCNLDSMECTCECHDVLKEERPEAVFHITRLADGKDGTYCMMCMVVFADQFVEDARRDITERTVERAIEFLEKKRKAGMN